MRTERSMHLVGSLPAESANDAMHLAFTTCGKHLHTLTDGETGGDWVIPIVESLRKTPLLTARTEGNWSSYKDTLVLRVQPGATLEADALDFGRVSLFETNYPLFQQLREEYNYPNVSYQVGLAGDFDMAFLTLGLLPALRYRRVFQEATLREIKQIQAQADGDVLFQIELPIELVFVSKMPAFLQPAMGRLLAKGVLQLVSAAPAGTRFGIHLCLGDLNNQALGSMSTTAPLVALANALISRWPARQTLEYVHVPLAAGTNPPPQHEAFYRDLSRLALPPDVRFVAGLVHEKPTMDEQHQVLKWVEQYIGRPVDIAAACGLGRRQRSVAETIMKRSVELIEAEQDVDMQTA